MGNITKLKKIAVFGGTFDPVHNGHIAIVKAILEKKLADKVVVLPSFQPPHKLNKSRANFQDRLNMLKLAFDGFSDVEVSDLEEQLSYSVSYTFDVLQELKKSYLNDDIILVIGGDSLKNLHTWYRAEEIVENFEIITYPRKNEIINFENLKNNFSRKNVEKLSKNIINAPFYEISSTILKKKLENNENASIFISEKVLYYIKRNKIYQIKGNL